ncbi:hypothetical protein AB0C65_38280 [Nocardia sp. NPDC048505]|uniref:hypothetical protein n=1 Tax=Nocardia sp. NPDC048505 TaxID=3155756 RepID=UPI0033C58FC0
MSPDGAVERVLSDQAATEKLLRVLAYRMRHDPPQDERQRWLHRSYAPVIRDLWQAYHDADAAHPVAMPDVLPAPGYTPPADRAAAHREATALVLGSPRSLREVLHTLTDWARSGVLARGEHSGTVTAARELLQALLAARLLRP